MSFAIGSLVKARDREWVVLPDSTDSLLMLRPLGGTDEEVTGILVPLETVESASFDPPDSTKPGDYRSGRLLREAVRLASRNTAGPFRSFGNIAVEPRSYQLVPLLMALKLDPVRLLIADDVGIGKTVEALLIAREMLDRGDAKRLTVLCPPHLARQWQGELRDKFHLDAQLVLPSTVNRLEKKCRFAESVFERYPFTVVSADFIKQESRRNEFLQAAPELVIVDEAHTCVEAGGSGRGSHQRYKLVRALAESRDSEGRPSRHMIFVTATPHSGKEEAFRSLLGLLRPEFANLPEELGGDAHKADRRAIAAHFVQRRRGDIRSYLGDETPFPERDEAEEAYSLTPAYKALFESAIAYARESAQKGAGESQHRRRVRWWSLLALLGSLSSSPAAAAETLRTRAAGADTETAEEADAVGRRSVFDPMEDEAGEGMDVAPGSDFTLDDDIGRRERAKLLDMARQAEELKGLTGDAKLAKAADIVEALLREGHRPIVFCRFIPTADYVADGLRAALAKRKGLKDIEIESISGLLPPAVRDERIHELSEVPTEHRVLVCTDCLSEGINLQEHFDAVMHYDLSWNPTRHEQREGRVDRFGQQKERRVRVVTYWGKDSPIDGIVLDTLVRKQKTIRSDLGITVPVPIEGENVVEAIFEGLLLREQTGGAQDRLPGLEEFLKPKAEDLDLKWKNAAEREKRSRTMFAQEGIKADDVQRELEEERAADGSSADVRDFVCTAVEMNGAVVDARKDGAVRLDLGALPVALQDAIRAEGAEGGAGKLRARFEMPIGDEEVYLSRTHPLVSGLASYIMDAALDPVLQEGDSGRPVARRCGAIRTGQVAARTTVLLARCRYQVVTKRAGAEPLEQLAEECLVLGFEGAPENARWVEGEQLDALLRAAPDANIAPEQAADFVQKVVDGRDELEGHLAAVAVARCDALADAHKRVRAAAQQRGVTYEVRPQGAPDVLGIYVYLPAPTAVGGAQ